MNQISLWNILSTANSYNSVSNFYYILALTLSAKVKPEYSLLE